MVNVIEVYTDPAGGWRWRAKGGNGEIVATGESYTRRSDATEAVEALFPDVSLEFITQEEITEGPMGPDG